VSSEHVIPPANEMPSHIAARMVGLVLGVLAAMAAVIVGTSHSVAQQGAPKAQPKAKPKATPTPQAQQGGQPDLTYSFWTKICQKGPEANAKQVCFLARDAHLESGMPVAVVVLVEPEGEAKKLLRVTLPLGVSLQAGTRVIIDNGQPLTGPYVICLSEGCMAEYEASDEMITKMKSGQNLHVQGINGLGQPINIPMPLVDFAKAYDGPPIDPKELEQQEKK
jgi:invasion protein IalB